MASSLSGSPIALSSDMARSSCRKTIRRISLEIACPDFRRNPTIALLPHLRLGTESSNFKRPRRATRQQRPHPRRNDSNLGGGQDRPSGEYAGRKKQRNREAARRGECDDDQFTPPDLT